MSAMDKATELLPCPFCGSTDIGGASGIVNCYGCNVQTASYLTTEGAVAAWNRRVTLREIPPDQATNMVMVGGFLWNNYGGWQQVAKEFENDDGVVHLYKELNAAGRVSVPERIGVSAEAVSREVEAATSANSPVLSSAPAAPKDGADELLRRARGCVPNFSPLAKEIDAYLVRASTDMVMVPKEPTVEWFRQVIVNAKVWPSKDAINIPKAYIKSAKQWHEAMLAASPKGEEG